MRKRYSGPIRLIDKELAVDYGDGKTIFVEHLNDLFADRVPADALVSVLKHCAQFPRNTYVFQTKNPARLGTLSWCLPPNSIVGTTIETDRFFPYIMGKSPTPIARFLAMLILRNREPLLRFFITIEPILDFDLDSFLCHITELRPHFVNIGADSKRSGLPEPSPEKVRALIAGLTSAGIEIRQKRNLDRLLCPR
jgi:hypothetical protein